MKADALMGPMHCHGHRDLNDIRTGGGTRGLTNTHRPEGRCACVTQDGTGSAAQNCRHPPAMGRQLRSADGVDTSPKTMKAAMKNASLDLVGTQSQPKQLLARDDPMLVRREPPPVAPSVLQVFEGPQPPKAAELWIRPDRRADMGLPSRGAPLPQPQLTCVPRAGTRAVGASRSPPPPRRPPRRGPPAVCRAASSRAGRRPGRCPPSCSSRSRSLPGARRPPRC